MRESLRAGNVSYSDVYSHSLEMKYVLTDQSCAEPWLKRRRQ